MLGRKSKTAVIEREVSNVGSRAAEVVGEAADRAVAAAQNAQRVAAPVLRTAAEKSAETLSHAAERAAVVLADTAGRLADTGEERAGQAAVSARQRLADASEALAAAVRPKKKRRVRRVLVLGAIAGGLVALFKSPLRGKLADRLFGAPPDFDDDLPESITLPEPSQGESEAPQPASTPNAEQEEEAPAEGAGGSNGVVSGSVSTKGEGAKS